MRILREAKQALQDAEKRKRFSRQFIVDTISTTIFWLIVHAMKDWLIIGMTPWMIVISGISTVFINLALGGVCGQFMNLARKTFKVVEE